MEGTSGAWSGKVDLKIKKHVKTSSNEVTSDSVLVKELQSSVPEPWAAPSPIEPQ